MNAEQAFERTRETIANQLRIDAGTIAKESRLIEDLGADSMDIIAMVMDLESELGVELPEDDLQAIKTVGDIVEYLGRATA